jgi:hypothetical protein
MIAITVIPGGEDRRSEERLQELASWPWIPFSSLRPAGDD